MKKILTASLVAMMAVTAANADIASTIYVDERTGDVANSTYVKTLAEGNRNLAAAVDALAANMGEGGSVATQIDNKINALDVLEKTAADGKYFSAYKQDDGKISMTEKAFDTKFEKDALGNYTSKNAPSTAAVADFVAAEVNAFSENWDADFARVEQKADDAFGKASTNALDIAKLQAGETLAAGAVKLNNLDAAVQTSLGKANTAVQSVTAGTDDGTISVDGTDVAVTGLGSAAYTDSSAYATAAQGTKANTAVQASQVTTGTTNGTIKVQETEVSVAGLGSAAYTEASAYATAAQGTKANTAVQASQVTTGTTNGTIKVQETEVSVAGLGSAAYTEASAYATATQGQKADTAMQVSDLKALASWSSEECATKTCSLVSKSGTIAWEKVSY